MDDEQEQQGGDEIQIPKWMPTFADMMTLLMCFFVLLLTFAEMDIKRYQQIAGSMASAFGVQRQVEAIEIPMGTSVIALEYSPGRPQPTPISEIWQKTTEELPELERQTEGVREDEPEELEESESKPSPEVTPDQIDLSELMKQQVQELVEQTQSDAAQLAQSLTEEITKGEVEIETQGRKIVLRIREKGSFDSGSADLKPAYQQLMRQVRDLLATQQGQIQVQGHTDDIPIATSRFRSNWELSSARAVSVAHELLSDDKLDPERFTVAGFADTRPLVANENDVGRERNRRVEIVIHQGVDKETRDKLQVLREEDPEAYKELGVEDTFDLFPNEIF